MTRLEELINLETLEALLDGFLKGWDGAFNVMPVDPPPDYLFPQSRERFTQFCKKVRSTEEEYKLCLESNRKHAEEAAQKGQPISHICHAGLLEIAVPIIVRGELIATILCGQRRSWNEAEEGEGRKRAAETERELGFQPGELLGLRKQTLKATEEQLDVVKNRLWRVAAHISTLGLEKIELGEKRDELSYRLRESEKIQEIMRSLAEIVQLEEFWSKVDDTLSRLCRTIGASCATLLVHDRQSKTPPIVKSVSGLEKEELVKKSYSYDDPIVMHLLRRGEPEIIKFDPSIEGTICRDIYKLHDGRNKPDQVVLISFALSGEHDANIAFFLERETDTRASLAVEKELDILTRAAPQIAIAFQNCRLFTEQKRLLRERDFYLEDVSHQLIAPLHSLQATSVRLFEHYHHWDSELVDSRLQEIINMSRWTARLARNFAWVVRASKPILRKEQMDMKGLLIGCARDVQGLAATKGVQVRVDWRSTSALPKLDVDRDLLIQAVVNLLDNAVKYADNDTEVVVTASLGTSRVSIAVADYGIPIEKKDVERIFERGYRTDEAKKRVAAGTGIGLTVARDIIRLHDGELSTSPSVYDKTKGAYRTTFTITLPRSGNRRDHRR